MLDLKTRLTLADWLDWALRHEQDQRRVRTECVAAIRSDPSLLLELLDIDDAVIWDKFTAAAKRHGEAMRAAVDLGAYVETTVMTMPAPARAVPLNTAVGSYIRGIGKRFKPPRDPRSERMVEDLAARTITMVIDGTDLRKWTLGRVKTRSRYIGHEARVLERIARDYAHHPLDTVEIGELMSDEQLAHLIKQCRR